MIKQFFVLFNALWNKVKRSPLFKLLWTYLLILTIPISIGYVYYTKTLDIVYASTNDENNNILKHISTVLDGRIREISSMASQIATNHLVTSFQGKSNPLEYPNTYSIIETRQGLPNYSATNEFILNYYIFFNKSNLVMNNQIAFKYAQFYNIHMRFDGQTYEEWYRATTENAIKSSGLSEEIRVTLYNNGVGTSMQVIPYYYPLPSYGQNNGHIAIYIPKSEIDSLLSTVNLDDNGVVYIENREGRIITHLAEGDVPIGEVQAVVDGNRPSAGNPAEITIQGKKMIATAVTTPNYTYVAVQSKNVVLKKVHDLKLIQVAVLLLSALLGMVVAIFFAKRNAKPLQEIITNLPEDENRSGDIFEIIKSAIEDLKHNNAGLRMTIRQQIPLLTSTFLSRLINAEFNSSEEIEQLCRYLPIPVAEHMYSILIIKVDTSFNSYDSLDLTIVSTFKHLVRQTLTSVDEDISYCDIDEQQLAVLLSFPLCGEEQFKQRAEKLVSIIHGKISGNIVDSIVITGGSVVRRLIDVADSYETAKLAYRTHVANVHSSILWYEKNGDYRVAYYFPTDIQNKLMNNVKQGNKQAVKENLETLFQHNLIKNSLSTSFQKLFIYELLGIIVKLSAQMGLEERMHNHLISDMDHIDRYGELKQIKTIMESFYQLCDMVNSKSDRQNMGITQQILAYVESQYTNDTLSLSSIANHFNMNESYLSYTFKQQNGIKLSVYIENLRIQKAKELLAQTSLTISQIAEEIGYLSANSFCRAFKRVTGINATTFRASNTG